MDGQIGSHFDASIVEGPQIYDEDEINAINSYMNSTPTEDDRCRNKEHLTTSASAIAPSVPNSSGTSASTASPSLPNSSGAILLTSQSDTNTAVGIPSTPTLRTFHNLDLKFYEEGYDSDGQIGPRFDANIAEGPQIYDEDEIDEIVNAIPTEDDTPDEFVMIASEDILKLKVVEHKVETEKRGLVCSGLKKNLQEILKKAMIDRTPISNAAVRTTITSPVIPRGFETL